MSARADQYEKLYPEALTDESQKEERMERMLFKQERRSHWRTGRNRGLIVPALPVDENGRLRP